MFLKYFNLHLHHLLDTYFLKKSQPPSLLFSFALFNKSFAEKICRLQRDSNSDRWNRRRIRWPLNHHHHHYRHSSSTYFCIHFDSTGFRCHIPNQDSIGGSYILCHICYHWAQGKMAKFFCPKLTLVLPSPILLKKSE